MQLHRYLTRLHALIDSRKEVEVESFRAEEIVPGRDGIITGRLRFWDGSLLEFVETLTASGLILIKTDYAYHYQNSQADLIFRYDNAPHHPQIGTYPHHKHVAMADGETVTVEAATPPDLSDVLREIDRLLYD